jgi:hypothetical protein
MDLAPLIGGFFLAICSRTINNNMDKKNQGQIVEAAGTLFQVKPHMAPQPNGHEFPDDMPKLPESQESEDIAEYEVLRLIDDTPPDPSKPGPKNKKKLVAIEVLGYQVGRGVRQRVVNPDDVYKLAAMGCNDREIARWFDIDENTLRYNFSDVIDKGQMDLKQVLRAAMIKNAVGGNAAVQIFLAKNMLGMSDTPMNSDDKKPLPWNDNE